MVFTVPITLEFGGLLFKNLILIGKSLSLLHITLPFSLIGLKLGVAVFLTNSDE